MSSNHYPQRLSQSRSVSQRVAVTGLVKSSKQAPVATRLSLVEARMKEPVPHKRWEGRKNHGKGIALAGLAAVLAAVTSACGLKGVEISAFTDRDAASRAGTSAFAEAGHPLDGALTCQLPDSDEGLRRTVICDGMTTQGKSARLTVELDADSAVKAGNGDPALIDGASITGDVGGTIIFTADCIGGCRDPT